MGKKMSQILTLCLVPFEITTEALLSLIGWVDATVGLPVASFIAFMMLMSAFSHQ